MGHTTRQIVKEEKVFGEKKTKYKLNTVNYRIQSKNILHKQSIR
jgi:hypothetical protein